MTDTIADPMHPFQPESDGSMYCRCGLPDRHPRHRTEATRQEPVRVEQGSLATRPVLPDAHPTLPVPAPKVALREPTDTTTLGKVIEWLRENVDEGVHCPACTQMAKVYRRKIHAAMARDLIIAHRKAGAETFHVRTVLGHDGGDFAKLAYWGLIEEEKVLRPDGGRAGWWRITPDGVGWVTGAVTVPKYARVYDGRCLSMVGEPTTIQDALGSKFDYTELMEGR